MVNTEDFARRLHQILEFYDLSAAAFADKIEVGRSSISHILSGRNKPSLDFVMKIIKAFPEVELYWLLNGKGNFPKNENQAASSHIIPEAPASFANAPVQNHQNAEVTEKPTQKTATGKAIKKIVIFYTDGTFEAFEN